jgi:hypothetical protein
MLALPLLSWLWPNTASAAVAPGVMLKRTPPIEKKPPSAALMSAMAFAFRGNVSVAVVENV